VNAPLLRSHRQKALPQWRVHESDSFHDAKSVAEHVVCRAGRPQGVPLLRVWSLHLLRPVRTLPNSERCSANGAADAADRSPDESENPSQDDQ
jgi:hypothetical protein